MVQSGQVIAFEWSLLAVASILVGLRLFVRVKWRQWHLIVSDTWLVLGAFGVLGLTIVDTLTYKLGAMDDFDMVTSVYLGQLRFATNYLFDAGLYLPKFSMLAMFFHIFPRHERFQRWALYAVSAYTGAGFLVTIFADTFWCGPNPSVNWSIDPDACTSFTSGKLQQINWAFCFSCECLILLLPLPLVYSLQVIKFKERASLIVLFTLGLVTLVVSIGRFVTMTQQTNSISLYIWASTEFNVSIMVASLMALKPLLRKIYGYGSRSRSQHSGEPSKSTKRKTGTERVFTGRLSGNHNFCTIEDGRGSDLELSPVPQSGITKVSRISISSEKRSSINHEVPERSTTPKSWDRIM